MAGPRTLPTTVPAYSCAIVRDLSDAFASSQSSHPDHSTLSLSLAKSQHAAYSAAVAKFVPHVVHVPQDPQLPDSSFVEDTCIVVNGTAVITQPGHPTRRNDTKAVHEAFQAHVPADVAQVVAVMHGDGVFLDGGDVLFTGRDLFVGLSNRSTRAGAEFLRDALQRHWANLSVHILELSDFQSLHLKCVVSALSPTELVVADTEEGRYVHRLITSAAPASGFSAPVWVPDVAASNVLAFPDGNGGLKGVVMQRGFPDSESRIEQYVKAKYGKQLPVVSLDMSEIIKADGALTCCSLLL
ncbi:hypothetical protein RI367_004108 [Sorochytrium milnesiophthora]